MGGFFLAAKDAKTDTASLLRTSRDQFEKSGFANPVTFDTPAYTLDYYPKIAYASVDHVFFDHGGFALSAGTFLYRGQIGAKALHLLYAEDDPAAALAQSHGHYLIVLRKNGRTLLLKDASASYELFLVPGVNCATTSFLAAARVAPRLTVDAQASYEYVFNGVSLPPQTPFAEIRRLDIFEHLHFEPDFTMTVRRVPLLPPQRDGSLSAAADHALEALSRLTAGLAEIFGNNIRLALSGGYDSRLLVALLRKAGVTPHLFVYGGKNDQDVRIAGRIAAAEGMALQHIDKSLLANPAPGTYPAIVERNFHYEDALPNGGIFSNGAEIAARLERSAHNALHINGGGGEVFRNFFNLLDRPLTPRQFVWTFYSQFDPTECTAAFDRTRYENAIADKVRSLTGTQSPRLSRREIESLYPFFRCRSWFGRENSINSRWGYSLLPFVDHQIVQNALSIPVRHKYYGNFESALIRRTDPGLAAHPSNYGHDFSRDAPASAVISDLLTYLRPPALRRHTFRLKSLMRGKETRERFVSEAFLEPVIGSGFPYMSRFFRIPRISSNLHFERLCTLEYLFQTLSAREVME